MASVHKIGIYQAEVSEGREQTYNITAFWKTEESAQPYQGNYRMEILSIAGTAYSVDTTKKSGEIRGASLDLQTEYTLRVSVGEVSDETPLLLQTYQNASGVYDGLTLKLLWDSPSSGIGRGRCFAQLSSGRSFSYEIPPYVCGMEIPMKEELYGQNMVMKVSLQPYTNRFSSGPIVNLPDLYHSRYMVSMSADGTARISYKNSSPEETEVSVELDGRIYDTDEKNSFRVPDTPIKAGPLELGTAPPYKLTVQTGTVLTRNDYDRFVADICRLVTPKAMYEILEAVTRCALYAVEDSLYLHCGLRPAAEETQNTEIQNANQRCADVRPGFYLRLEQEMYMPEGSAGGSGAAGFVGTHTAEYLVSVTQGNSMQYLEFDSFISAMEEELYPPREQSGIKPIAGGIIDLCSVRMRAPYYRIQYPDGIFSSDALPDSYEENHTRLIADAGWNYIPASETRDAGTGVACLWFRGRSALSLLISVVINGIEKRVPVGTTLGSLLHSSGIYGVRGNEVKWYRRSPFGREVPICFPAGALEDMALLNGDRILV